MPGPAQAGIAVAGITEPAEAGRTLPGVVTSAAPDELSPAGGGSIVTAIIEAQSVFDGIVDVVGGERAIVPPMLVVRDPASLSAQT